MEKNYYYVSPKKYIVSQLERNGIHIKRLNISDYENVCKSAKLISGLLEKNGLLCRKLADAVHSHIVDKKFPFVYFTLENVKYYFHYSGRFAKAVCEYRFLDTVFSFIIMISGKFTEELYSWLALVKAKKYFGEISWCPDKINVLGKISWDGDKAYIQPIIIY
ncbi:MAG: hypothetical protein NC177_11510 [Ruminococcus flavefaciens]|nr:hypothetical protein [Ruminococcus flavefaciens]